MDLGNFDLIYILILLIEEHYGQIVALQEVESRLDKNRAVFLNTSYHYTGLR